MALCSRECSFCPVSELGKLRQIKERLENNAAKSGDSWFFEQKWVNVKISNKEPIRGENDGGVTISIIPGWARILVNSLAGSNTVCYLSNRKYGNKIFGGLVRMNDNE